MSKYTNLFGHNIVQSDDAHVTHRAHGDIPGCVPAVAVFIERSVADVHKYLHASADRYVHIMMTTDAKLWKNHPIHAERALSVFTNN